MEEFINRLYHNPFVEKFFHTTLYCLKKELKNCKTVLDLGCGPDSYIKYLKLNYTVGVDAYKPYINKARKNKTHHKLIYNNIAKINFRPKSFDAVVLIEVLEHLSKTQGRELLLRSEKWARKKIILTTPNGYISQGEMDGNPYQKHKSGWSLYEMKKLGYRAYGMAGFKFLSLRGTNLTVGKKIKSNLIGNIQHIISSAADISQVFAYYFPRFAFRIFYTKCPDK
jgi:SAM-dependent methyltransferase